MGLLKKAVDHAFYNLGRAADAALESVFCDEGLVNRAAHRIVDWVAQHPLHDPEPDNVYQSDDVYHNKILVVGNTKQGDVTFRQPSVFPTGRILAGNAGRAEMMVNPGVETTMPLSEFRKTYSLVSRNSAHVQDLSDPYYGKRDPVAPAPGAPKYDVG